MGSGPRGAGFGGSGLLRVRNGMTGWSVWEPAGDPPRCTLLERTGV